MEFLVLKKRKINLYPQHEDILFYFCEIFIINNLSEKALKPIVRHCELLFNKDFWCLFLTCVSIDYRVVLTHVEMYEKVHHMSLEKVLKCWIRNINLLHRKDALPKWLWSTMYVIILLLKLKKNSFLTLPEKKNYLVLK